MPLGIFNLPLHSIKNTEW